MNEPKDTPIVTCPTVGYQTADVCVPVTVTPYATTGSPVTSCCGDPIIVAGRKTCDGTKNGSCIFTITQRVCVAVPVEFGATAVPGDTYVDCIGSSADECVDCNEADAV